MRYGPKKGGAASPLPPLPSGRAFRPFLFSPARAHPSPNAASTQTHLAHSQPRPARDTALCAFGPVKAAAYTGVRAKLMYIFSLSVDFYAILLIIIHIYLKLCGGVALFKVFIDGREGTTGLRISERLSARADVDLIVLPEAERKDPARRKWALNACDAAILCLPDAAAREAVSMVENEHTVILDASTAHRTAPGWAYGLPELGETALKAVLAARRVAVPGCHASGFIALVAPLVRAGLLAPETPLSCVSLTGYSGGGKKMIADYREKGAAYDPPRPYGLAQTHKHLPEMTKICGLLAPPVFLPVVGNFYSGMLVSVPLHRAQLLRGAGMADVRAVYADLYRGPIVVYRETLAENGFASAGLLSGRDGMYVSCEGNEERFTLLAAYDNLGKGASGAAVQLLNLKMGAEATAGLAL